jgi:hypothetical protein
MTIEQMLGSLQVAAAKNSTTPSKASPKAKK